MNKGDSSELESAQPRSASQPLRADYGIDAPGVVRNLALIGAAGLAIAVAVRLALATVSPPLSIALCWTFASAGLSLLFTAAAMLYGSRIGKLKERERLLDRLVWRGDETVLDVGCGRGLMLTAAAKRLTSGTAVGVDIWQTEDQSGNSPEVTQQNARAEGVADRVEILDGDARGLPFPDCSFDTIVSSWALHNIYDPTERAKAIDEIIRVLKPGGQLAIMDIRHAQEYAQRLRSAGCEEVKVSGPRFTFLIPSLWLRRSYRVLFCSSSITSWHRRRQPRQIPP